MSSTLVYVPSPKKKEGFVLSDSLKFVFRKKVLPRTFTIEDMGYLEGLRDAGVQGVDDLIEGILKFESIDVYEEF